MSKTITLSWMVIFMFMATLLAQPGTGTPSGPPSVEKRLTRLSKTLALTEQQQEQVRQILEDTDAKMKKALEENKGDRRAIRAAMRDLNDQANYRIMNLLNDKQKQTFKNYLKEQQQKRSDRTERSGRRGGGGGGGMRRF